MVTKSMTVELAQGAETRPVAFLVQVASQFDSSIYLEAGEKKVNAKSIMGMMSLALLNGEKIVLDVEGEDEEEAAAALEKFLTE